MSAPYKRAALTVKLTRYGTGDRIRTRSRLGLSQLRLPISPLRHRRVLSELSHPATPTGSAQERALLCHSDFPSGEDRTRTRHLLRAKQLLSQDELLPRVMSRSGPYPDHSRDATHSWHPRWDSNPRPRPSQGRIHPLNFADIRSSLCSFR